MLTTASGSACLPRLAPSTSGPSRLPFKQDDAGSNPAGVTCEPSEKMACSGSVIRRWQAEIRRRLPLVRGILGARRGVEQLGSSLGS